jgi:uncharacterized membrane protein YbjE (DUF340 family)
VDYLIVKLLPYLALALAIGLFVGWYSCSSAEE